jgi:hypothetical protein
MSLSILTFTPPSVSNYLMTDTEKSFGPPKSEAPPLSDDTGAERVTATKSRDFRLL